MRDLVVTAIVVGSLPFCLASPYIGVVMWTWISMMNPHKLTWGFAFTMPMAQIVAVPTLLGLLVTRQRRAIPFNRESVLLAVLWGYYLVTTLFAFNAQDAWLYFDRVSKILLMTFVTILVCQDRKKLRTVLLVVALSIGFYGFKGGIGTSLQGLQYHVLGPEGTSIGDNNGLALGLTMTIPFLFFLARDEPRWWLRLLLRATIGLSIISIISTYSRAGFLGLVVVLALLLIRTRWKPIIVPGMVLAAVLLSTYIPDKWFDRIATIAHYEQDGSAMARLVAWGVAWRLALDNPLVGGGFGAFGPETFKHYLPDYGHWLNAHSIYFHVLGEHGFVGLFLYLAMIVSTMVSLTTLRRRARRLPAASWMVGYTDMVRVSLIAFLIIGAFYNLSHFDLFYLLVGITIILKRLMGDAMTTIEASVPVPVPVSNPWRKSPT